MVAMNIENAINKIKHYAYENWVSLGKIKACEDGGSYVILHPEEFGLMKKDDWIKVVDALPRTYDDEFSRTVIISVKTRNGTDHISMGAIYRGEWYWHWHTNNHKMSEGFIVTHWRNLPDSPKP